MAKQKSVPKAPAAGRPKGSPNTKPDQTEGQLTRCRMHPLQYAFVVGQNQPTLNSANPGAGQQGQTTALQGRPE